MNVVNLKGEPMEKPEIVIVKNAAECVRLWKEAAAARPAVFKRIMIDGAAANALIRRIRVDLEAIERTLGDTRLNG
jgi:hypothetical protein